jgi:PIN domain nuclease of toxin-antitoxin system
MAGGRALILLDTCALLWLTMSQRHLSATAKATLAANTGRLHVSPISAFEIGQKHALGKLALPTAPAEWFPRALELHGLREVAFDSTMALAASALPRLHADPFDRLLIATAQISGFTLLTPDPKISAYPTVKTLW